MLMAFCLMSALTLTRLVRKEVGPPSSWRRLWPCSRTRRDRTYSAATGSSTPHTQETDEHHHDHLPKDDGSGGLNRRVLTSSISAADDGICLSPSPLPPQPLHALSPNTLGSPSAPMHIDGRTVASISVIEQATWPDGPNSLENKREELRTSLLNPPSHNAASR